METILTNLLRHALTRQSSDIHLVVATQCEIKMRVLGKIVTDRIISKTQGQQLVNYIRYIAKIDTNFKLKPQTGGFDLTIDDVNYSFRVSSMPSLQKDSLVIRILNNHAPIALSKLSRDENINHFFRQIAAKSNGLVLICGATGSGKTTALYAILDYINNNYDKNIISIEDPIEVAKDYCLQVQINEAMKITYTSTLEQILRHDPDVIMIGEIREQGTAQAVIQATLTGHLVLSTIHASNCTQGISRLRNLEISEFDLQETLAGIACLKICFNHLGELILLSEFIDKPNIASYLAHQPYQRYSFQDNLDCLASQGHLDWKLKRRLEDEL